MDQNTPSATLHKPNAASRGDQLRQKIENATRQLAQVDQEIATLVTKNNAHALEADCKDAQKSEAEWVEQCKQDLKTHTATMTKYNDMKDAAMQLLGLIAERQGRTLKSVMDEREIVDN